MTSRAWRGSRERGRCFSWRAATTAVRSSGSSWPRRPDDGKIQETAGSDPDEDNGPFTSGVYRAGKLQIGRGAKPVFRPDAKPELLAPANGMKIESVALRASSSRDTEIFHGTDDENYGAVLRQILLP